MEISLLEGPLINLGTFPSVCQSRKQLSTFVSSSLTIQTVTM